MNTLKKPENPVKAAKQELKSAYQQVKEAETAAENQKMHGRIDAGQHPKTVRQRVKASLRPLLLGVLVTVAADKVDLYDKYIEPYVEPVTSSVENVSADLMQGAKKIINNIKSKSEE